MVRNKSNDWYNDTNTDSLMYQLNRTAAAGEVIFQ